jgi:acetylornithine deacetylase/succinyl-diaminopimelate desuccinylase-like protein
VHGFIGGFSGPGIKTVIPSQATAKVTFRLVPQQDPQQIFQQMSDYLQRLIPPTVQLECKITGLAAPATVDLDAPVVQAAISAFSAGFGAPPRFVRGGGSLPILSIMQAYLSPHALITGFGLPEDGEHGPNESFDLNQFSQGITTMIHYFHSFAANENE